MWQPQTGTLTSSIRRMIPDTGGGKEKAGAEESAAMLTRIRGEVYCEVETAWLTKPIAKPIVPRWFRILTQSAVGFVGHPVFLVYSRIIACYLTCITWYVFLNKYRVASFLWIFILLQDIELLS